MSGRDFEPFDGDHFAVNTDDAGNANARYSRNDGDPAEPKTHLESIAIRPMKGRSASAERTPTASPPVYATAVDPFMTHPNKFDPKDSRLTGLLENNRQWATAVQLAKPNFFKNIAVKQEPKILWIGCSDSRVPAGQVVQLGPGEVFVHRNIANVVTHTDISCLSVLQYAVEKLKVEHIIVCGHYECGGVAASMTNNQLGLIDNWLRNIKDIYRANREELNAITDLKARERRLVELNVETSAHNVAYSSIVQNAWAKGQNLKVHAWVYNVENGLIRSLPLCIECSEQLQGIFVFNVEK